MFSYRIKPGKAGASRRKFFVGDFAGKETKSENGVLTETSYGNLWLCFPKFGGLKCCFSFSFPREFASGIGAVRSGRFNRVGPRLTGMVSRVENFANRRKAADCFVLIC